MELDRVVSSDELFFCFFSNSRPVRVWRRRGDWFNPAAIVERPTTWKRVIIVYSTIEYYFRSLVWIQGPNTTQKYVDDVLGPMVFFWLQGVSSVFYWQDNAWPQSHAQSICAARCIDGFPGSSTFLISGLSNAFRCDWVPFADTATFFIRQIADR